MKKFPKICCVVIRKLELTMSLISIKLIARKRRFCLCADIVYLACGKTGDGEWQ